MRIHWNALGRLLTPPIRQGTLGMIAAFFSPLVITPLQTAEISHLLTPPEYAQFTREKNPAKQVRFLLKIGEKRLQEIKRLFEEERFESALERLASYQALLEHAFSRIEMVPPGGKRKNAYRDFDLHVRKHLRDLEALERAFPAGWVAEVERVRKTAVKLRFEALNAFAGEKIFTRRPHSQ